MMAGAEPKLQCGGFALPRPLGVVRSVAASAGRAQAPFRPPEPAPARPHCFDDFGGNIVTGFGYVLLSGKSGIFLRFFA